MNIFNNLLSKQESICIIGLGYVGLPLATLFSEKINVIGYDLDKDKIEKYKSQYKKMFFTDKLNQIKNCSCYIIAVPTPIDENNRPDLNCVIKATENISKILKANDLVIYESTVYPGVTENICVPIIERNSKLRYNKDIFIGYSPERINPNDKIHNLKNTTKIVAGCNKTITKEMKKIYGMIIENVYEADNIKTAEAAKLIENTQRDVNIALMNEFENLCEKLDINIYHVIKAARTKWNFYECYPGLVGGHCISVDPYYYIALAEKLNVGSNIVQTARHINENMVNKIVKIIIDELQKNEGNKILIMGITYKANIDDIRNSKVLDIIDKLQQMGIETFVYDNLANRKALKNKKLHFVDFDNINNVNLILFSVMHDEFKKIPIQKIEKKFKNNPIIIEIGETLKGKCDYNKIKYISI